VRDEGVAVSVVDEVERFHCPNCGGGASARVRHVSAWGGEVHAVSQIECHGQGCAISKEVAELALGVCSDCEHRMRRVRSREQSVAGGEFDWYCDHCRAIRGDATVR
jgi:ssDNA-binding Zn-finger/Zn-ribbon topoisomerase 1